MTAVATLSASHHTCPESEPAPSARVWLVVMIAMGALVASTIVTELAANPGPAGWLLALDIGVGVVGCAALPLVSRWPLAAALLLIALSVVSPAATPLAGTATLWLAQRRPIQIAAAVAAVAVAAQVLRGVWRPVSGLTLGWWFVLVVAAFAAVVGWGAMIRARRALIAELTERAWRAESEQEARVMAARRGERTRIAREMHDVLAHRLSLIATYAGALEYRPGAPAEELSKAAEVIRTGAHQALEELREVIGVLREDVIDADDLLSQHPQPTLVDLARLIDESRQAGVAVDFENLVLEPASVPTGLGRAAYRIVQEGLTNARKHAGGQSVRIRVRGQAGSSLEIEAVNEMPGDQVNAVSAPRTSGTGLVGLGERAHLVGGTLEHGMTANDEFRLHAALPWQA